MKNKTKLLTGGEVVEKFEKLISEQKFDDLLAYTKKNPAHAKLFVEYCLIQIRLLVNMCASGEEKILLKTNEITSLTLKIELVSLQMAYAMSKKNK